jgi:hypothetical protein
VASKTFGFTPVQASLKLHGVLSLRRAKADASLRSFASLFALQKSAIAAKADQQNS